MATTRQHAGVEVVTKQFKSDSNDIVLCNENIEIKVNAIHASGCCPAGFYTRSQLSTVVVASLSCAVSYSVPVVIAPVR